MLDDFFVRALLAGIGVALVTGPLGCIIVWRRMAYFGDTLAHAALLGVALGFLLDVEPVLAVFAVSVLVALLLVAMQRMATVSADALLGLLAHGALAFGLVTLGFMTWLRVDLMGLLFGDILAVGKVDLAVIWLGGAVILAVLALIWQPLFAATVSPELAEAEGLKPDRANLVFIVLLALVIAIAMKIVGVMLITAMLIIPAAAARLIAGGPERMAVLASLIGVVAVIAGLELSLGADTPSGPSIVVAAVLAFGAVWIGRSILSVLAGRGRMTS